MKQPSLLYSGLLIGLVALMGSCSSYTYTARTQPVQGERIAEPKKAVEVEVDLNKPIQVVGEWSLSAKAAKSAAEYKAIKDNKIDVVVDPIYKITVAPVFNTKDGAPWYTVSYRAEISGYSGTYKKILSQEEQINQLKNVEMADIEKFKLLNEPDFYKYYYHSPQAEPASSIVVQQVGAPFLPSASVKSKQKKLYDELQAIKLIRTGKAFVGIGGTFLGIAACCGLASINAKRSSQGDLFAASMSFVGMGGFFGLAIGAPCWGVGAKKLKTIRGNNMSFNYNISPAGVNLALQF